jgi:radical SAM superfamily enzyme YgiQ (UPF0313 family)
MADIVLLQLPIWGVGIPPLGLAILKSYLIKNGVSCRVFDLNAHIYSIRGRKYSNYWDEEHGYDFCNNSDKMQEFYYDHRVTFLYYMERIRELGPKVVGCSCFGASIELTKIFLEDLRNFFPHYKHLLGGPEVAGFMGNADQLLSKDYIDAICLDEGEVAIIGYLKELEKNEGSSLPGIVYKRNDSIIRNASNSNIKDLDQLPFPDFSDFNLKYYRDSRTLPSYSSRNCINKCVYCSARGFMKPFRFRSGKRMFEEFKYLKKQYPDLNNVRMADNISNGKIKELESFCDLMIKAKLGVKWNLENAVIRKEMRTPLYKKLKKAGCTLIGYGMETPSPDLLKKIGKRLSKDVDIVKVLKEGKKAGIYISVNVMFGLPGETEEDFDYLMRWLSKNKKSFDMINPSLMFCEFYPGCLGHDQPEKFGIDLTKGTLFWETNDQTNTYLIRMDRFERFCKMAKTYKLENLFNIEELPNKNEILFKYYIASNQKDKAIEYYDRIDLNQRTSEIIHEYKSLSNENETKFVKKNIPLTDILPYEETFEESFISTSLEGSLEELENAKSYMVVGKTRWRRWIRSFVFEIMDRILGHDMLDKKLGNCYSVMKVLDAKLRCYDRHKKRQILK